MYGAGINNTVFLADLWKDNEITEFYTPLGSIAPNHTCFNFCEATYGAGLVDISVHGTTRLPANSSLIHISGGGGAENMVFDNLHLTGFKYYAVCMGQTPTNHPRFTDLYIQNCCHPIGVGIKTIGNLLSKFKVSGSTINSGSATPCSVYRCLSFDSPTEAITESFHFEQYGCPVEINSSSSIIEMRGLDGIAHKRAYMLEGLEDGYINVYILYPSKIKVLSNNSGTLKFRFAHGFKPGTKFAIFGGDSPGIYECTGTPDATTITSDAPGTATGYVSQLWYENCHITKGTPLVFHKKSKGTVIPPGATPDSPYWINYHRFKDVSCLDIDIAANRIKIGPNNFRDGDATYIIPALSGASIANNFWMPEGLDARTIYYLKTFDNDSVALFYDKELTKEVKIISESGVEGNGGIGDEPTFVLWPLKAHIGLSLPVGSFYYCNMISPLVISNTFASLDTGIATMDRVQYVSDDGMDGYVVSPITLDKSNKFFPTNEMAGTQSHSVGRVEKVGTNYRAVFK